MRVFKVNRSIKIYILGILFGVISLLIKLFADHNPEWIEAWYSNGIFPYIRQFLDTIHQLVPIPLFYLSLIGLIAWLFHILISTGKNYKRSDLTRSFLHGGIKILGLLGFIITWFYWLWGFNYSRSSLEDYLDIDLSGLTLEETQNEYNWITGQVIHYADTPAVQSWRAETFRYAEDKENAIRSGVHKVLKTFNFSQKGNVPLRFINPKGVLLRINTAGFYWPFTGESHVDDGMYPLQWPYVIAHELFHGFGISDEGDCNFLALLACLQSQNDQVIYSGLVGYWRYVASDLRFLIKEDYDDYYAVLPLSLKNDLKEIHKYLDQYPDIMPKFRNMVYNSYLKSQGVHDGMKSYSRVVMLNYAWRTQTD